MSIPGAGNPLLLAGVAQYKIERSLRFNSADSAYLSRTPASAGNRKTWTWAGWVKRSTLTTASRQMVFTGHNSFNAFIGFATDDKFEVATSDGSSANYLATSDAVFRDTSAWMHIVVAIDTPQASTSNRARLWVNGVQQTLTGSFIPQNGDTSINLASAHRIGSNTSGGLDFSGYLADIHFIDGQALTPSSFGETDANGVWQPKAFSGGSYGTNGFKLAFADNSAATATTLGKDTSPNGNNWTPNNLSVTAGTGNDSLVDTPTSYGSDTGAGGEVRGNYCTWNPLDQGSVTLTNGNLDASATIDNNVKGTIAIPESVKIYFEFTVTQRGGGGAQSPIVGICTPELLDNVNIADYTSLVWCYSAEGTKVGGGASYTSYGNSLAANDVLGVAVDRANGRIWFSKNGTWQNSGTPTNGSDANAAFTNVPTTGTIQIVYGNNNTTPGTGVLNAGQRPFAYTAPSGFKALCTQNLPTPTITKPSTVMDVALWTGNGSARSITGLGFNPDLVWIKGRSGATDHALYDSVRGVEKRLESNNTDAEVTSDGGVTAFNSDGFSLGTLAQVNTNTATYAGWTWDAGSSTVTNTDGTISSQVRANASAGFSIVSYTGTGSGGTIGHGLGIAPQLVLQKIRNTTGSWQAYHSSIGATKFLNLDTTDAAVTSSLRWNNTAPTGTVVTVGTVGGSAYDYVLYCFAPVAGYSAFGSYTGNGSADGPMVFTNMRPRWIMLKRSDSTSNWTIIDTAREGYNVDNDPLYPNLSNAEGTTDLADILSNGFKLRSTDASVNASGGTYVYACFAESPFALARAR